MFTVQPHLYKRSEPVLRGKTRQNRSRWQQTASVMEAGPSGEHKLRIKRIKHGNANVHAFSTI